jgi:hypothetical protein
LFHDLDALCESVSRLRSHVNFTHFSVHLDEVVVDELIHNLGRKVNPDVKDSAFVSFPESVLQVFLNVGNNNVGSAEVDCVPVSICLVVHLSFLADTAVGKQVVDKLDGKNLNLVEVFENRYIDMSASRDVEENSVYEEQESLDVQELAPGKAKIKKELRQSLIVDTQTVKFSIAINSSLSLVCPLLCKLLFLFDIHKTLVLFFSSR